MYLICVYVSYEKKCLHLSQCWHFNCNRHNQIYFYTKAASRMALGARKSLFLFFVFLFLCNGGRARTRRALLRRTQRPQRPQCYKTERVSAVLQPRFSFIFDSLTFPFALARKRYSRVAGRWRLPPTFDKLPGLCPHAGHTSLGFKLNSMRARPPRQVVWLMGSQCEQDPIPKRPEWGVSAKAAFTVGLTVLKTRIKGALHTARHVFSILFCF